MIHDTLDRRKFLRRLSGLIVPAAFGFPAIVRGDLGHSLPFLANSGNGCVNADVATWVTNATTNEGSAPSGALQAAVCTFANAMASLKSRTPYIGIMAPGATVATQETPLFCGPINSPSCTWTPGAAGGAGINGLTANAVAGRYWNVEWTSNSLGINNSGFSIYMPVTPGSGAFLDYGGYDGTFGVYAGLNHSLGVVFTIGLVTLQATITYPGPGYFSFNRTASNVLKVYWGNDATAVAQIGSTVTGDNSAGAFPGGTAASVGRHRPHFKHQQHLFVPVSA